MQLVAEVILPLPVKSVYSYRIVSEWEELAMIGSRVLVVFGKNKVYTGIIKIIREEKDYDTWRSLKPIDEVLDPWPTLRETQLKLFEWIAFYYFCSEGEVLKAALPAGLKLESVICVEDAEFPGWREIGLDEKSLDLLDELQVRPSIMLEEVAKLWKVQNPQTRLRNMEARGLIRLVRKVKETYKPKTETWVEFTHEYREEEKMKFAFDAVKRAAKQEEVLMLVASEFFKSKPSLKKNIAKRINGAAAAIKALCEKGILREFEEEVGRMDNIQYKKTEKEITLNEEQKGALVSIRKSFSETPERPVLLHGITGSGKTHIYIELIKDAIKAGKQALYLLPEIALTQQIIDKVKSEFGDKVGIYHSRQSNDERVEIWKNTLNGMYDVVIGVRSAIFLPLERPGIIVVDEEHDHSFKQDEPNPRYNAKDVACYASGIFNCHVLLGSATPSFESYQNAVTGKFGFVELHNRIAESKLPKIEVIDNKPQRQKKLNTGFYSQPLMEGIAKCLERREQVILLQNRRGFVPVLQCTNCGSIPKCINCDIHLTYHKASGLLKCHYCGFVDKQVDKCRECNHYDLLQKGIGTQKVEEELKALFPAARIARMDFDTTRSKQSFQKLIRSFEKHEIDILVGTQMVAKGLDFENVTLVGVVDADGLLQFADFRANERVFQLLTQVSGRAGRSHKPGHVLIQTWMPDHTVFQHLQKPYRTFFDSEIKERQALLYPPFSRLIRIEMRNRSRDFVWKEGNEFAKILKPVFETSMLGPAWPTVERLRNEYRLHILIKVGKLVSTEKVRKVLAEAMDEYYRNAEKKTLRIVVDVDPS